MSVAKPTELIAFLEGLGIRPKKGLSQNFLIDGNIIRKIISTGDVLPRDVVVEVGPGPGALTQALLESGATVIAIEKDRILAKALERLQTPDGRLHVYEADFLTFPIEKVLEEVLQQKQASNDPANTEPAKKAKFIANLPYHLTTPILERVIPLHMLISRVVIMVQKEVAQRMTAVPGSRVYGSLTVFLSFFGKQSYAFSVSSRCFMPAPKVDSAVVAMDLQAPPLAGKDLDAFFKMTRGAFGQKRKMVRTSLRELYSTALVEKALIECGVNPMTRPEELSLESFLFLFEKLKKAISVGDGLLKRCQATALQIFAASLLFF